VRGQNKSFVGEQE